MKQVIVVRKDLGMRKGKMIAQGAHASLSAFLNCNKTFRQEWWESGQKKIVVGCNSEEELIELYEKARKAGVATALITDAAHTEFKVPTRTAVAIGPDYDMKIDPITGELVLL